MIGTIISLLVAGILAFGSQLAPWVEPSLKISVNHLEFFFTIALFLSLLPWMCMLFLSRGAEGFPITMAGLRSNIDDKKNYVYSASIMVISLLGLILVSQRQYPGIWSFAGGIVCAGVLLDLFRAAYCRVQYRRTPEGIAEWFIEVMKRSVRKSDEKWYTISFEIPIGLMVVYIKSGAMGSLRLFCHRIAEISNLWLGSMARLKVFRHSGGIEEGMLERYSNAEALAAKRFSWVIQEACSIGSLPGLEETVRLMGKLFISFHNHHKSLGFFILLALSESSKNDEHKIRSRDISMEVISTLVEITQELIEQCIDRNTPDTQSILKVFAILDTEVKEAFRREKDIDPALLSRPFAEIVRMLGYDRYRSFPGRVEVVAELRRIFSQFDALAVLTTHMTENVYGGP